MYLLQIRCSKLELYRSSTIAPFQTHMCSEPFSLSQTEGPFAQQKIDISACQPSYPGHSTELSNPATWLPSGYTHATKKYKYDYHKPDHVIW